MLDDLIAKSKNVFLTWRTGMDADERAYTEWRDQNLGLQNNIKSYFYKFKHIIEVNHNKVYGYDIAYYVKPAFRERFCYPARTLGDHTELFVIRGEYDQVNICLDNCFGGDHAYIGTNNDEDAIMIALMYQ